MSYHNPYKPLAYDPSWDPTRDPSQDEAKIARAAERRAARDAEIRKRLAEILSQKEEEEDKKRPKERQTKKQKGGQAANGKKRPTQNEETKSKAKDEAKKKAEAEAKAKQQAKAKEEEEEGEAKSKAKAEVRTKAGANPRAKKREAGAAGGKTELEAKARREASKKEESETRRELDEAINKEAEEKRRPRAYGEPPRGQTGEEKTAGDIAREEWNAKVREYFEQLVAQGRAKREEAKAAGSKPAVLDPRKDTGKGKENEAGGKTGDPVSKTIKDEVKTRKDVEEANAREAEEEERTPETGKKAYLEGLADRITQMLDDNLEETQEQRLKETTTCPTDRVMEELQKISKEKERALTEEKKTKEKDQKNKRGETGWSEGFGVINEDRTRSPAAQAIQDAREAKMRKILEDAINKRDAEKQRREERKEKNKKKTVRFDGDAGTEEKEQKKDEKD